MSTPSHDRPLREAERAPSHSGVVVSVRGSVVDMRFDGPLPPIYSVLRAGEAGGIVVEVLAQREEGIVAGGGVALLRCREAVAAVKAEGDEAVGVGIIRRALEEPLRQIAANAGHEGAVVVARVREMKGDEGFNALTDTYENLVEAGIIDPTKVVRCALQNAASIAFQELLAVVYLIVSLGVRFPPVSPQPRHWVVGRGQGIQWEDRRKAGRNVVCQTSAPLRGLVGLEDRLKGDRGCGDPARQGLDAGAIRRVARPPLT